MEAIFGNKDTFAIECSITSTKPHLFGKACIWIKGVRIGSTEEDIMLESFLNSIKSLNERLEQLDDILIDNKSLDTLFDEIYNSDQENGKYFFTPSENFDDFNTFVLVENDYIHFYWQLVPQPFFEYTDYPMEKQHEVINCRKFRQVLEKFESFITKRKKGFSSLQ